MNSCGSMAVPLGWLNKTERPETFASSLPDMYK